MSLEGFIEPGCGRPAGEHSRENDVAIPRPQGPSAQGGFWASELAALVSRSNTTLAARALRPETAENQDQGTGLVWRYSQKLCSEPLPPVPLLTGSGPGWASEG